MRRSRDSLPHLVVLFFLAKLFVNTAARFVYAFLPDVARGLGVSEQRVGTLLGVRWIAGVTTPLAARLAGGERRRTVVLAGLVLFVVGAAVTAATGAFAGAVVGFALMGVATPLFNTGSQAEVADRTDYSRRGRTLGILEATWSLSLLVGAPFAGWLIGQGSWSTPFWVSALLVAVLLVPIARSVGAATDRRPTAGRIVWNRATVAFLAVTVLIIGSVELVFVSYATWLEEFHGLGVEGLAVAAVAIGFGELVGETGVVAVADRFGKRRTIAAGLAVAAVAYGSLGLGLGVAGAIAGLAVGVAGFELAFVSSILVGTEMQPQARIRFLSRVVVVQGVGRGVAAVSGITLYRAAGIGAVGAVAAVASVTAAVVMLSLVREHAQDG